MILTTTDQIAGRRITACKRSVAGQSMLMASASGTAVVIE